MYTRILVPLDGSARAEAALPWAEAFARLGPSTLYLVRATTADDEGEARRYLDAVAAGVRARGLVAETSVLVEEPVQALVREAARRQADLVVMTTRARSGPVRWVLGSIADQVLHQTPRPVLVVRADHPAPGDRLRRVLVPLDGSALAERALVHARALVGPGGDILLYHVVPLVAPIVEASSAAPVWADVLEDARADAQAYLERVAAPLRAAGYRVQLAVECGAPAERIAAYARTAGAQVIVVSSHGRAGAARWLLGSVADELVPRAPVPLLVLRPLLAVAGRALQLAGPQVSSLDAVPLPPPATVTLSGRQVQLVRLALEGLLSEARCEEPLAAEIRGLLDLLPAPTPAPAASS